jgi:UrcA family protein
MTSRALRIGARVRTATAFALIAACVAVSAAGSARAASLADDAAVPALKVRYGDLNLATEQGSLALYARIQAAAQQVCAPDDIRDLQAVAAARSCRQQAIAQAVHDVHSPALASVYAAQLSHG